MKVLYITFVEMDNTSGASDLRPKKIYEAFIKLGIDVILLSGEQSKKNKKNRVANIRRVLETLKYDKIDFCYIESSTYPIMFRDDIRLMKKIKKKGIPMAYFYRDCYRAKPFKQMVQRKGVVNFFKDYGLDLLQSRTDFLLRKFDIIYFPSELMMSYFHYKVMKTLPPAATQVYNINHEFRKVAIYVGGVSKRYGIDLMINAFKLLNEKDYYKLILVCRENELGLDEKTICNMPWLEVHHTSGEGLVELYQEASIALLPLLGGYNDFAISVKLYEYLSFGLPVVSTNVSEMSKIVMNNCVGIVSNQTAEEYAKKIEMILANESLWIKLSQNTKSFINNKNLWEDRVRKIQSDLIKESQVYNENDK